MFSNHALFQVSTSTALVSGVLTASVTVADVLRHGDFGLGTYDDFDGELVVLDGAAYRLRSDGTASRPSGDAGVPFAAVTRFHPTRTGHLPSIGTFAALQAACDRLRRSENIFFAIRIDGHFRTLRARAVKRAVAGRTLVEAAKAQAEFTLHDVAGTLVGVWSPGYSSSFSITGYHFHFISEDRSTGGHLLDCAGTDLSIQLDALRDFHLALPETESFLRADLSQDAAAALAYAEQAH